jgi:ABC-type branched-subunit amino acid transport system substrate-binding protein
VLLILGAADQIVFEAQLDSFGSDVIVAPLSDPVQQTRDYLGAERDRTYPSGNVVRVLAWEPNRAVGSDMSERYAARFGQPMQSSAYAGYQAVMAAAEALDATDSSGANELIAYLTAEGRFLDGPKGPGVSFRASDRQLRQPLDLTEVVVDAEWRNTVDGKLGIASFVATVPDTAGAASDAEAAELLDEIGTHGTACEAPR